MANLMYGSGKTGGLGVDFFDPAARAADSVALQQGQVDLQQGQFDLQNAIDQAVINAGMLRQVGTDEYGNPQYITISDIQDQIQFQDYLQ
jgi:hypothetical protein